MCVALLAVLGVSTVASGQEAVVAIPLVRTAPVIAAPLHPPAVTVNESNSCASECQARHDRCRVQTKGSATCDAERQYCLEICLQKKKR